MSSKLDADTVKYKHLKHAIMKYVALAGATGAAGRSTAMDIGSIASVSGGGPESTAQGEETEWPAVDENGWPIDEEGWPIDGRLDGQLNFVKGAKGKGKATVGIAGSKVCGKQGHRAAECPNPPLSGGKAKGETDP